MRAIWWSKHTHTHTLALTTTHTYTPTHTRRPLHTLVHSRTPSHTLVSPSPLHTTKLTQERNTEIGRKKCRLRNGNTPSGKCTHTHAHTYTHSWSLRCLQAHSNTHWSTVSVAQDDRRRRRRRRTVSQSDEKRREKTHRTRRQQTEFWVELCVCGWPGAQAERFGKRNMQRAHTQAHTHRVTGERGEWWAYSANGCN